MKRARESRVSQIHYLHIRPEVSTNNGKVWEQSYVPFPQGTAGFLYYFCPQFAPPHTGEIRFRITESSDPASFNDGRDLLDEHQGLPYGVPLRNIVRAQVYYVLLKVLKQDGLVTDKILKETLEGSPAKRAGSRRVLYALNQPFYVDLQFQSLRLHVIAEKDNQITTEACEIKRTYRFPYPGE